MVIPPFYALVRGVAIADYWHNHSDCFIVKSIALADRFPGHDDRGRCPYCAMFDSPVGRRPTPEPKAP
jgi:hypothetical protein